MIYLQPSQLKRLSNREALTYPRLCLLKMLLQTLLPSQKEEPLQEGLELVRPMKEELLNQLNNIEVHETIIDLKDEDLLGEALHIGDHNVQRKIRQT